MILPLDAIRPYVGRVGIFPAYTEGEVAKAPAAARLFPDLAKEERTRATGDLVRELRDRATSMEEAERWWRPGRVYGVGLNCGDYQCLDFDDSQALGPWCEALRRDGAGDLLGRTARVRTMSGGFHVWAFVPGCRDGSRALARHAAPQFDERRGKATTVRIETRGYGAYALIPPSPGYRWQSGPTLLELPPLKPEEFARLVRAAEGLDRGKKDTRREERKKRAKAGPETPNEWFERTASWDDLIEGAGGTFFREAGDRRYYTRPGKTKGVSVTSGNGRQDQDLLKVHTANWPPFEAGEVLSKYYFYATLHHGRDLTAATRAIAAMRDASDSSAPRGSASAPSLGEGVPRKNAESDQSHEHLTVIVDAPTLPPTEGPTPRRANPPEDYLRNDLGNARRLVARHGDDLRFCVDWARFLTWDGVVWRTDTKDNGAARRLAHDVADAMATSEARDLRVWGQRSGSSTAISAMLREAQALVPVEVGDLDTHEGLIGVRNGVLDLSTGRLVDDSRTRLITKQANVAWDPDATCPRFERFIGEIMGERGDLVALLLRVLGYCLTGSTREQKFFLLYGARGRNGKSTLLELMQTLLGKGLCGPINKKLLTASERDSARFAMASMEGRRMVFTNESGGGGSYDTEFIKEFAGGTTVQAEKKGQDEYSFKLQAKLLHSVNSMPSAEWSGSYGDRAVPIPFEQSWYARDNAQWRDGDLEPDRNLDVKLRAELPGVLALLVRAGSIPWFAEGLRIPGPVASLLETYRAENDTLGGWIAEWCEVGNAFRMPMQEAYDGYRAYMKASGIPYRGRISTFHKEILARPGVGHVHPQNRSIVVGLRLRPEHDRYASDLGEDEA